MCEILIKAVSQTNPDPLKDAADYKAGDLVLVKPDGASWGDKELLPDFVRLTVTATTPEEVLSYCSPWKRSFDTSILQSTLATDTFRIAITAVGFNPTSGVGKLTRNQIETYLNKWSASVVSVADNSVTFDVAILGALGSEGFWTNFIAQKIVVTQQSYTQATGNHRISIEYSALLTGLQALGFSLAETRTLAQNEIERRGGSIVSNDAPNAMAVVDFTRANVKAKFDADILSRIGPTLARRIFRLSPASLATIIANGGLATMTKAQALAALEDRRVTVI